MSSAERQGRHRRGALTSPSSIHNFPFGAGLLVLQVIVQEHFPQQVALPRQINVMSLPTPGPALEWNKAEHPRAAAGRAGKQGLHRQGAGLRTCHGTMVLTLSPYLFLFTSICCSVLSTLMHSFSSVSMRSLVCCTSLAQQSHRHTAERDKGVPEGTVPTVPPGCRYPPGCTTHKRMKVTSPPSTPSNPMAIAKHPHLDRKPPLSHR